MTSSVLLEALGAAMTTGLVAFVFWPLGRPELAGAGARRWLDHGSAFNDHTEDQPFPCPAVAPALQHLDVPSRSPAAGLRAPL